MTFRRLPHAGLFALALVLLPAAAANARDDWDWTVAPYLWAPSVGTDLNEDAPPVGNEVAFDDIIDKIDMALQLHVEGQGDRFGAFGDMTYLSLSDEHTRSLYGSDASLKTTLVEAGGVWNLSPARFEGLDVLFGLRYVTADLDATLDPTGTVLPDVGLGFDKSFLDALAGVRYVARLSDRWQLSARLDGSWGQTDGTVGASLLAGYRVGKGSFLFGYRYLGLELGDERRALDVTMKGPIVSYAFGL